MKHRLLGLLLCGLAFGARSEVIFELCYEDVDNFPWHIKDGHGLSNLLVEMAAARAGIKLRQLALPWKRCLNSVERGEIAGAFGASFTDERAAYAVYPTAADGRLDVTRRLKTDGYTLFRRVGERADWDGRQFINLSGPVGAQIGYSVIADLKKFGVAIEEGPTAPEANMRKLLAGRIQLLALLTHQGDDLFDNPEFAGRVEKLQPAFTEKPYFVIFGKTFQQRNRSAVEAFWTGLGVARDSKEFRQAYREQTGK